jgi:predicted CopG family antitoxin
MFNDKTITVTQEAYNALIKQKRDSETLSDTILRLTKNSTSKTQNYFGKKRVLNPDEMRCNFDDGWYSSSDML